MREIHTNIMKHLVNNDIEGAKNYCKSCSKKITGASIINAGLEVASLGEHRMEKAIESEAQEKIFSLENPSLLMIK